MGLRVCTIGPRYTNCPLPIGFLCNSNAAMNFGGTWFATKAPTEIPVQYVLSRNTVYTLLALVHVTWQVHNSTMH
jgi:hypothetical protein